MLKDYVYLFDSKKYKVSEKRLFLIAIVQQLIYSKEIFHSNESLKEYIKVFEVEYDLPYKDRFKEYLYKSRTQLAARVCRLIIEKNNLENEKKLMDWHLEFLKSLNTLEITTRDKGRNSSLLRDYLKQRSGSENDEK